MTRKEAINTLANFKVYISGGGVVDKKANEALDLAIATLVRLPSANRPKGHWVRKKVKIMCPRDCWRPSLFAIEGTWNEEEGWNLEWRDGFCSECGKQDDNFRTSNYCSNCGVKMKGVDNECL